jgi:hypothetical protein
VLMDVFEGIVRGIAVHSVSPCRDFMMRLVPSLGTVAATTYCCCRTR